MPLYTYTDGNSFLEVFLPMNQNHDVYTDEQGKTWQRTWEKDHIQGKVDGKISCWNIQKQVEKTNSMKGSLGDLYDMAAENSAKRAKDTGGIDPIAAKEKAKGDAERQAGSLPSINKNKTFVFGD